MATTFTDIRAAFESDLATYAAALPAIDVAYENDGYTPVLNTPWLRAALKMEMPVAGGPGDTQKNVQRGVFSIDIMQPVNAGATDAMTRADDLASRYKRGNNLTSASVTVIIEATWPGAARQETVNTIPWFVMPASILFFAHTDNV